jgi:hypothetical protein
VILIDLPRWPAHDTLWSHLVSDSSLEELHEFAARAGIPRRGFDRDHYDVPEHRYAELVAAGAEGYQLSSKPVTLRTTAPVATSTNTVVMDVARGSTA